MILHFTIIIILIFAILYVIKRLTSSDNFEGMDASTTNSEAIANIASLYNKDNMTITNLNVTGENTSNSIKATQLLVEKDKDNVPAYNNDVVNALNDLNNRLITINERLETVETHYVDTRKQGAYTLNGWVGGNYWGAIGASIGKAQ